MSDWEFTPADRQAAEQWFPIMHNVLGLDGDQLANLATVAARDCDDCAQDKRLPEQPAGIYLYGSFTLCRSCALSRLRVARQLASERAA